MKQVFAIIIVTQAVAANLRDLARMLDKANTGGMFQRRLSATGSLPATHRISHGLVPERVVNLLKNPVQLYTVAKKAYEDDGLTFPFTQTQVTNALAACTISDGTRVDANGDTVNEDVHALMARLGLKFVVENIA